MTDSISTSSELCSCDGTKARTGEGTSAGTAQASPRASPTSKRTAPSLPDVLRQLDDAALGDLVAGISNEDLASLRLACRGLRDACTAGVRRLTVTVSQDTAKAWRPGRRSPLSVFPWCSHLTLNLDSSTHGFVTFEGLSDSSDDDDDRVDTGYGDSSYSHLQLATLAVAGVSPEARSRIKRLTLTDLKYHTGGSSFDLAGVLSSLLPLLPGLENLDASGMSQGLEGMGDDDRARQGLMYAALAAHCPRLRSLQLPAAPGMLYGVGALAAGCGGLRELSAGALTEMSCDDCWVWASNYEGNQSAVLLGPEEVVGLSQLRALRVLRLRCHDRSPDGANLASLLGGQRPPALESLELAGSVRRADPAAAGAAGVAQLRSGPGRLRMPWFRVLWEPAGTGRMQEVRLARERYGWHSAGVLGYNQLARVLLAATDQTAFISGRPIQVLHVAGFPISKAAGSDAQYMQCLAPNGHLARLLVRCDRVLFPDTLHAAHQDSQMAVHAVLGLFGLPERLVLRHGEWKPHASNAPAVSKGLRLPLLPPSAAAGESSLLRLASATAEGVLREAVERLWLAAKEEAAAVVASDAAAGRGVGGSSSCGTDRGGSGGGCSGSAVRDHTSDLCDPGYTILLLRNVQGPMPPPSYGSLMDALNIGTWCDAQFGGGLAALDIAPAGAAGMGVGLDAALSAVLIDRRQRTRPCQWLDLWGSYESIPCVRTVLLRCATRADATELAAMLTSGAAAAEAGAADASGGSGAPAPAAVEGGGRKAEAAILAAPNTDTPDVLAGAVLQVLTELWECSGGAAGARSWGASKPGGGGVSVSVSGRGSGGAPDATAAAAAAAAGGYSSMQQRAPITCADLARVEQLLRLDAEVSRLYRAAA